MSDRNVDWTQGLLSKWKVISNIFLKIFLLVLVMPKYGGNFSLGIFPEVGEKNNVKISVYANATMGGARKKTKR